MLGGGEGATIKEVLDHPHVAEVVMVDIDEQVVRICQEYLPDWSQGAYGDPRLRLYFMDAAEFIKGDRTKYDLIVWDVCDPGLENPSQGLYTEIFFDHLSRHLSQAGLLAVEYSPRHHELFGLLTRSWKEVHRAHISIPSYEEDWVFQILQQT